MCFKWPFAEQEYVNSYWFNLNHLGCSFKTERTKKIYFMLILVLPVQFFSHLRFQCVGYDGIHDQLKKFQLSFPSLSQGE